MLLKRIPHLFVLFFLLFHTNSSCNFLHASEDTSLTENQIQKRTRKKTKNTLSTSQETTTGLGSIIAGWAYWNSYLQKMRKPNGKLISYTTHMKNWMRTLGPSTSNWTAYVFAGFYFLLSFYKSNPVDYVFLFIYIILFLFLERQRYHAKLNDSDKKGFIEKMISSVHGISIATVSILYLLDILPRSIWVEMLGITRAYIFIDMLLLLFYTKEKYWENFLFFIHHTTLLYILNQGVDRFPELLALGLISELCNFVMYYTWYLLHTEQSEHPHIKISGIGTILSFITLRSANYTRILTKVYKTSANWDLMLFAPITLMNYWWTYKLGCQAYEKLYKARLKSS